jgi:hypothetical protein
MAKAYHTPLYVFIIDDSGERYTAEGERSSTKRPYLVRVWRGYPREELIGHSIVMPKLNERVCDAIVRQARSMLARQAVKEEAV